MRWWQAARVVPSWIKLLKIGRVRGRVDRVEMMQQMQGSLECPIEYWIDGGRCHACTRGAAVLLLSATLFITPINFDISITHVLARLATF